MDEDKQKEIPNIIRYINRRNITIALIWAAIIAVLILLSSYSFLLFHSFAEIFSIVIAFAIFTLVWNSRHIIGNHYLLFIGISYLFIGGIDFIHALAYEGMGVFPGENANLATQLWIGARYLQSISLLIAPVFIRRKINPWLVLTSWCVVTALLLASIFYWKIFPDAFLEGTGLTSFKVISEYVISLILAIAIWLLLKNRSEFSEKVVRFIVASIVVTIVSEVSFTLYINTYGILNMAGHVLKIIAFFLLYKAIVETGIKSPYDLLFRNLKQSEEKYHNLFSMMTEAFALHEIILDESGQPCDYRFIEVNKAFEEITGLSGVEGKTAREIIPEIETYWIEIYGKVALNGEPADFENFSSALAKWYQVYSYSPERGRFVTLFRDITEQKKTGETINALSKFPAENPNPVMRISPEGTVTYANEASKTLLDFWSTEEGQPLPEEYRKLAGEILDSNTRRGIEVECGERIFYLSITPVKQEGYVNIYGNNITGRKRAENIVEEERDRLLAFINSISDEVWVADMEGNFVLENETALQEFGMSSSGELNIIEMAENLEVYCADGTLRPASEAPPLRALRGEIVRNEEEIIRTPSTNELKYRQVSSSPVRDQEGNVIGSVSIVCDITGLKHLEEELVESQKDLKRAQKVAQVGNWRIDVQKNELVWSDEAYRIFDIPAGTPMNYESFLDSVYPDDREFVDSAWNAALEGDEYNIEHRINAGGEVKWVREIAELEFDDEGMLKGGFGTVQDITEIKKAEQLKDEFIGLVSHELRTPLTIIIGSIKSAMTQGISTEDMYELLYNASEGAESLAAILENMLELSRYQADRLKLEINPVNVPDMAVSIINRLKGQQVNQRFLTVFSPDIPYIEADRVRIERILVNLLENAVKYSPSSSEITVSCRLDNDFVITEITDQGEGISTGDQEKLFEPFHRFGTSAIRTGGIGLGLIVCKRLVEAHGGWIKVNSIAGKGSTFYFAVPIHQADTSE
jgi:PAS domain S-box-containing protein